MKTMFKNIAVFVFFCLAIPTVYACNLGQHQWEEAFPIELPLAAPILVTAEINTITDRFSPDRISRILWANNTDESTIGIWLKNIFSDQWPNHKIWQITRTPDVNLNLIASDTLIAETDSYRLHILVFRDRLSACHQLVFFQEGRFRLVCNSALAPVAEQYSPRTWLSIYFFAFPAPGNIMSLSFAPVRGHTMELYLNRKFVEWLLDNGLVQRRPPDFFQQYPEGFPLPHK
jgi:hypothetical protein